MANLFPMSSDTSKSFKDNVTHCLVATSITSCVDTSVFCRPSHFLLRVPPNIQPGEVFEVYAGDQTVRVMCPPKVRPGNLLDITVPIDQNLQRKSSTLSQESLDSTQMPSDSSNVSLIEKSNPPAYMVAIPD